MREIRANLADKDATRELLKKLGLKDENKSTQEVCDPERESGATLASEVAELTPPAR